MIFYGVLSLTTKKVFELFATRAEAEGFIAEVEGDAPELAERLKVIELEFAAGVT